MRSRLGCVPPPTLAASSLLFAETQTQVIATTPSLAVWISPSRSGPQTRRGAWGPSRISSIVSRSTCYTVSRPNPRYGRPLKYPCITRKGHCRAPFHPSAPHPPPDTPTDAPLIPNPSPPSTHYPPPTFRTRSVQFSAAVGPSGKNKLIASPLHLIRPPPCSGSQSKPLHDLVGACPPAKPSGESASGVLRGVAAGV